MSEREILYKNLILLLKVFKNRPYHLAKYLIDNSALNSDFESKIIKSNNLKKLSEEETDNLNSISMPNFNDIHEMNEYLTSLIDDIKSIPSDASEEEISKDLNDKLDKCIREEQYEDAARIRDYMNRNNIKRINNFLN